MTEKNFVSLRIKLISHAVSVQRIFSNDTGSSRPGRNRIRNGLKKIQKKRNIYVTSGFSEKNYRDLYTLR